MEILNSHYIICIASVTFQVNMQYIYIRMYIPVYIQLQLATYEQGTYLAIQLHIYVVLFATCANSIYSRNMQILQEKPHVLNFLLQKLNCLFYFCTMEQLSYFYYVLLLSTFVPLIVFTAHCLITCFVVLVVTRQNVM